MKYKYFQINALIPESDSEALNAYISAHAVSSIKEIFVDDGENSFWSVRVIVTDNKPKSTTVTTQSKRSSVDYREILDPDIFVIFAKFRTLRNTMAVEQNIPAYAIFTNEQLAEMAKLKQPDKLAISKIEGIGEKRMTMYVEKFLAVLNENNG